LSTYSRPRVIGYAAAILVAVIVASAAVIYFLLHASLPQLTGRFVAPSKALHAHASIERDGNGTPTIKAASRVDLAYATGFAHAQDRFFQMDLMRRAAAGELAELLGPTMIDTDRKFRVHDFKHVAAQVIADADQADRRTVDAYVSGVNAGLSALRVRPWEYLVLRSTPRAWTAEDSILVAFTMYLNLNDSTGETEIALAMLHDTLPPQVYGFLHPYGTSWDAPLIGRSWQSAPIPSPDSFDLRTTKQDDEHRQVSPADAEGVGSNSWAVDGAHTASGAALLANDMHLALRLPHVWYRARLQITTGENPVLDLVGVTLPGLPMLIVGSNGHVAWSFTNSYGDWSDVVIVEPDPTNKQRYLFDNGAEFYRARQESIRVRGQASVRLIVRTTRWGPVIGTDASGRTLVLAWTAHHARASNLQLLHLEQTQTVVQALDIANRSGGPVQNFVAADSAGHIGWTLMGQVPVRANYDSSMPASWRPIGTGWIGWRTPSEYPRVMDPSAGRLWTANARTIDPQSWVDFLGDSNYELGARANQIRDALFELDAATAADMLKIQLDDRALFLTRWHDLLLTLLTPDAVQSHAARAKALQQIRNWSAHAATQDVGYRIVRAFRLQVRDQVFNSLIAAARKQSPLAKFQPSAQFEGPLWQMIVDQPAHLLSSTYSNWNEALLHALDQTLAELQSECGSIADCSWGRQNTLVMRHPLSSALPWMSRWLDMPGEALPGDVAMPRVQGPSFGASERMVVSPGREREGILQLPGGPVDHPLSPFYGAGHAAWVHGDAVPLLPGKTAYKLELAPG
jgi:penicillin amidase